MGLAFGECDSENAAQNATDIPPTIRTKIFQNIDKNISIFLSPGCKLLV